jgi:hypothetical protein
LSGIQEADKGEIILKIPGLEIDLMQDLLESTSMEVDHKEIKDASIQETDQVKESNEEKMKHWDPIVISIHYQVKHPSAGLFFQLPDNDINKYRYPVAYTHNQTCMTRLWMPTIDSFKSKCTWEIQIVTPRTVGDALRHLDVSDLDLSLEMKAICSGDLIEQTVLPEGHKKVFVYRQDVPVLPSSILFAVGPFEIHRIPTWEGKLVKDVSEKVPDRDELSDDEEYEDENEIQPAEGGYACGMPPLMPNIDYTVDFMRKVCFFYLLSSLVIFWRVSLACHFHLILLKLSLYKNLILRF